MLRSVTNGLRLAILAGAGLLAGCASTGTEPRAGGVDARYAVKPDCPDGYVVKAGLNTTFPHKGLQRAFVVHLPADLSRPAPVWVPLTGTVESTTANLTVPRSGANAPDASGNAGADVEIGPVSLMNLLMSPRAGRPLKTFVSAVEFAPAPFSAAR